MATVLDLSPITHLTRAQFYQLERTAKGELVIVAPVGGEGGAQEANLIAKVVIWNEQTKLGVVFSSSTIFRLPNNGDRFPDVAWVKLDRWESLSEEEREEFPPIGPDFIIELRSRTDRLKPLQEKMQEYQDSGLRLGWLINPQSRQVEIYRLGQPVEVVDSVTLSGEDVLPGFSIHIS